MLGIFPDGLVLKNVPANAEDMGLILGLRPKTPHAVGWLSLCSTTVEPEGCNYWARVPWDSSFATREAPQRGA